MIARIWRGTVCTDDADEYVAYVRETGIEHYRSTPGNHGAWILHRASGDKTEILTFSLWQNLEAVKAFAGDDPSIAAKRAREPFRVSAEHSEDQGFA